ncbi:hypothetical protein AAG570_007220 [Ranatra chinensis]|uniref:C2H2-type domain-containing protein n=1 Tax=Ranatra chinensis TaxID=642074 RepID=A0ABD0YDS5_9HEMI
MATRRNRFGLKNSERETTSHGHAAVIPIRCFCLSFFEPANFVSVGQIMESISKLKSEETEAEIKEDCGNLSVRDDKSRVLSSVISNGSNVAPGEDTCLDEDFASGDELPCSDGQGGDTEAVGETFGCDVCDYRASGIARLTRHKWVHREKLLQCDQCDYKTNRTSNLKLHKMRHSGEKPFMCDQCDYRATDRGTFKKHQMRHTKEKPFACDQCDYRAIGLSQLKRHKYRHGGEKPFVCDRCDYRTVGSSQLKKHKEMRHSGEKPQMRDSAVGPHRGEPLFRCDRCNYGAGSQNMLTRHKRTHTNGGAIPGVVDTSGPAQMRGSGDRLTPE